MKEEREWISLILFGLTIEKCLIVDQTAGARGQIVHVIPLKRAKRLSEELNESQ